MQALVAAGYDVSVVCPKGAGDPSCQVIGSVRIYKYRPYAPGGSAAGFAAEYAYSFIATAWLTLRARRRGRRGVGLRRVPRVAGRLDQDDGQALRDGRTRDNRAALPAEPN